MNCVDTDPLWDQFVDARTQEGKATQSILWFEELTPTAHGVGRTLSFPQVLLYTQR